MRGEGAVLKQDRYVPSAVKIKKSGILSMQ